MKLHFDIDRNKFVITEIDYDMIQLVVNGLECERKKIVDKISVLSNYLWKDYSKSQKDDFKFQISFLKEKNENLKSLIEDYISIIENVPI